ncbi:MAG: hypothetical protein EI684_15155 [Candidatus Viridilinea halotolerans]|uniref:Uncharacterized protein n=1 Tax=Candidatus Viridilinea halotolerans TaxID=2491704 RepID=A0A426TVU2_9CHLR|nr:MAG: hypothetical protein EI684_15155 [Candidatus Viridilinea halotolerans]
MLARRRIVLRHQGGEALRQKALNVVGEEKQHRSIHDSVDAIVQIAIRIPQEWAVQIAPAAGATICYEAPAALKAVLRKPGAVTLGAAAFVQVVLLVDPNQIVDVPIQADLRGTWVFTLANRDVCRELACLPVSVEQDRGWLQLGVAVCCK